MERLTERDAAGRAYMVMPPVQRGGVFRGNTQKTMQKLIERLAAYEDKGMAPEEIPQRCGILWMADDMDWRTEIVRLLRKNASGEVAETALNSMSGEERLILDRCYIHRRPGSVEGLAAELQLKVSEVYRRRDRALRRFALAICEAEEEK